jgi:hypothetical protein
MSAFRRPLRTSCLWQGSRCATNWLKVHPPIIESDRVVLST